MRDFKIAVFSPFDKHYFNMCKEIVKQHKNLKHEELIADYFICALKNDRVLGFVGVVNDREFSGDFYISQISVDKNEENKGIATALLQYAKAHSKGYKRVTSDVLIENQPSISLHEKLGFKNIGYCISLKSYRFSIDVENCANNEYIEYTEESELV